MEVRYRFTGYSYVNAEHCDCVDPICNKHSVVSRLDKPDPALAGLLVAAFKVDFTVTITVGGGSYNLLYEPKWEVTEKGPLYDREYAREDKMTEDGRSVQTDGVMKIILVSIYYLMGVANAGIKAVQDSSRRTAPVSTSVA